MTTPVNPATRVPSRSKKAPTSGPGGLPAISATDRILHRVLSKRPDERYSSADALATDLRGALQLAASDQVAEARPMLRLAVLPFRLLKRDPDTDYLGLSLADALVSSLTGLESLVVRSSLKSARYANTVPDLEVVAADLAVDVVLLLEALQPSDAAAEDATAAFRVFPSEVEAAVLDGLRRGNESKLAETIETPDGAGIDRHVRPEVLHFAAELHLEQRGVEVGDGRDAARPGEKASPVLGNVQSNGVDRTESGNRDPSARDDAHGDGTHCGGLFLIACSM